MFGLIFVYFAAIFLTVSSQRCIETSFSTINVRVYINASDNVVDKQVRGCISPSTVPNFNENGFLGFKVSRESVPILKKAFVTGFRGPISIDFEDNRIETVKRDAFWNLPGVRSISLLSNGIKWLEAGAFSNLPSLQYINLEKNSITALTPYTFDNLPKLERLVLSENQLSVFKPEAMRNVPNLQILDLNENHISEIRDDAFTKLSSLRNLDLYGNRIHNVESNAFRGLKQLVILNLANNEIVDLTFNVGHISNLAVFHLEGNAINYVPSKFLRELAGLKTLKIYANPLQCSCLEQLSKWSVNNSIALFTQCKDNIPVCVNPLTYPSVCTSRTEKDFSGEVPNFKVYLKKCY